MPDLSGAAPDPVSVLVRSGRRIRWLLIGYCLLLLTLTVATLLWPDRLAFRPSSVSLGTDPAGLALPARLLSLAIQSIPLIPIAWVIWHGLNLCRSMTARLLFTAAAPRRLRAIGIALLVSALLRPVANALSPLLLAGIVPTPPRAVAVLSADDFGIAIVGAVLIAVAAAAQEAVRLADENARFI